MAIGFPPTKQTTLTSTARAESKTPAINSLPQARVNCALKTAMVVRLPEGLPEFLNMDFEIISQ
jgi:hypothetical protein